MLVIRWITKRTCLSPVYAITRSKAARNAWYWAVHFKRRGKLYFKRFYDLTLGGTKKALAAAIDWRDRSLVQAKVLTYREFHEQTRSNNTSGVPGVHFLRTVRQPQGVWQAKIKLPDGRKPTKAFSVQKFGRREAFKRAVAARNEMLRMLQDRPYIKHPTAKRFVAKRPSSAG